MPAPHHFATDFGKSLMLSAEQQAIVHSKAASAIIAALAGTGKTTTLACAAVHMLRQQPKAQILVLAYSKSGVQAFQQRLRMLVREVPRNIHITTMERWCARQLRQQDAAVRFVTDPIELRAQAHKALLLLKEQLQRHPDARLDLPSEVDMQAFAAFNRAAKKSLLLQRLAESGDSLADFCDEHLLDYTLARLFTAYERLRIDHCDDTLYYAEGDCTYALAQDDSKVPPAAYDLVLFDEMHDLDLASLTVLCTLLSQSQARFLGAGDFNQHIEAQAWSVFQDKLHQLADFLPQQTANLPLTQSRRFGPQVAQAINRWFKVDMKAPSTRRSTVTQWTYDSDVQCLDLLLQAQASMPAPAEGPRPPLTVILRHAHDACALEWHIFRAGRSASLHGLQPFYLHRDIALLLGLLYAHGMQALGWKSQHSILGADILSAFIDGALYFGKGQTPSKQEDSERSTMAAQMHGHPLAIERFLRGETHLQGGQRNFSAFGKFFQLPLSLQNNALQLLEQADIWGLFAATPLPAQDKAQLQARVRNWMASIAGLSVPQVLQQVADMVQRSHTTLRHGGHFDFQLLSIEQAKGQEFECVALPFLEPGRFPAPAPKESAFLERNRLYVAMTRAKHRLWLLESATHPVQPLDT